LSGADTTAPDTPHQEEIAPVRHQNPNQWRELGNRVASIARAVAQATADTIALGGTPPAAIYFAERDLWRWADTLHYTTKPAAARTTDRYAAVILLVELPNGPRDLGWLGKTIIGTAGPIGDGWAIRHTSTYPDFGTAFEDPATLVGGGPR